MKKLKNKIILLLALTVLLFVSCANGAKDAKPDDGRLSVVTTNFALYDFARRCYYAPSRGNGFT